MWFQFTTAIVEDKRYFFCAAPGCGRAYEVTPDVARTNRRFCDDACRVRGHRAKKQQARQLRGEGKSLREIARLLDSDMPTIKGWVNDISKGGK